ncbi:unnamed protein product [Amoebophrya sp. A120]|nr:unnamed protein product [Amoebophrya sp. A120]|eukprot:GSA120T00004907001.1
MCVVNKQNLCILFNDERPSQSTADKIDVLSPRSFVVLRYINLIPLIDSFFEVPIPVTVPMALPKTTKISLKYNCSKHLSTTLTRFSSRELNQIVHHNEKKDAETSRIPK